MTGAATDDARRAAELAARASYGRLVAYLARRWRDVGAAEDALGDAFVAALATWPRDGVPEKPEAWLLAAARRRLLDGARHATVQTRALPTIHAMVDEAQGAASSEAVFPDERLALLFVCAHPAIDEGMRTPLMLQTVLGLDAARIAAAFVVPAVTMGQRLVRVKTKIRDAGIRFEVPEPRELPVRLGPVLEAIYAAYGSGWDDVAGADTRRRGLAEEAIWLGRLVARLVPDEPEAHGLLAPMLHCEARRGARRDPAGGYVPLSEQDATRWSWPTIEEAERILLAASRAGKPGRFQLEAAVQSAHAQRGITGRTDWAAIVLLYGGLIGIAPTVGATVARAAALAEAEGPERGLAALDAVLADATADYQPFWALRAHLLGRLGRGDEAASAYARAIELAADRAVRAFLAEKEKALWPG
ncbi:MAG: RNA polymerase sigma factor [Candidatus Rokuibacteriota bacterium]